MKLISSKQKFKSSIFTVTEDRAIDPGGFEIKRAIVRHAGSAVVMPVDAKGRILLVKQYRLPARRYLWELPAGRMDPGESVLAAARRELQEETGIRARKMTKLSSFFVSPGFLEERMTIFLAEQLEQGESEPMEDERIEMAWYSGRQIDAMIRDGKILDAKTIIGFLAWKRYGARKAAVPSRSS